MYNDKYFSKEESLRTALAIAHEFLGPSAVHTAWCEGCRENVPMVTPETAAVLERTTPKAILRRIAGNELHCCRSELGACWICLSSLISGQPSLSADNSKTEPRTRHRSISIAPLVALSKVTL